MRQPSTNHANMASVPASNTKASCLLLHGSFHGGWCWEKLLPHLPASLDVRAPSLTLSRASIGLADHVAEVAAAIDALPSDKPYIAIAHSYAGMVLPGAIAKAGRTPQMSLFLDAFVPNAGESAFDLLGNVAPTMRASARAGYLLPPPAQAFGVETPDDLEWCEDHLAPMPLQTHEDAAIVGVRDVRLGAEVFCTCAQFQGFIPMQTRAETMGWALHWVDGGHDAMITAPEELGTLIGDLYEMTIPQICLT